MEVLTLHGPALQTRHTRYGSAPRTIKVHGVTDATPCAVLWRAVYTAQTARGEVDLEVLGFPVFYLEGEDRPVWDIRRPIGSVRSVRVEFAPLYRHACTDRPYGSVCGAISPDATFDGIWNKVLVLPHADGGYYLVDEGYPLAQQAEILNTVLVVYAQLLAPRGGPSERPEVVDDLGYCGLDDERTIWGVGETLCVLWVSNQLAWDQMPARAVAECPSLLPMVRAHYDMLTEYAMWKGQLEHVRRLWTLVPPTEDTVDWVAASNKGPSTRDPRWPQCSLAATYATWDMVPLTQAVKARILLDSIGHGQQQMPRAPAAVAPPALDEDDLEGPARLRREDAWHALREQLAARLGPYDPAEGMIDLAFRLLVAPHTAPRGERPPADLTIANESDAAAALMLVHAYHRSDPTQLVVAMLQTLQRHYHDPLRKAFVNDIGYVLLDKMTHGDAPTLHEALDRSFRDTDPATGVPRDVPRAWLRAHAHGAVTRIQRLARSTTLRVAMLRQWLGLDPPRRADRLQWCQTLLRTQAVVPYDPEDLRPLQAVAKGALAEDPEHDPVGGIPFERGDWIGVYPCGHGARLDLLHAMDGNDCFECGNPLLTLV